VEKASFVQDRFTRIPIGFPDDLYEWLRQESFERRVSMAELVREAVRKHREISDAQMDLWPPRR
jgi:hypothetical protein